MIVSVGINIDNKKIRCRIYKNGSRDFEKNCNKGMVSALISNTSLIIVDLKSEFQPRVDNLVALLDARSENDIKAVFEPFRCPATVKYIDGKVMIGRERDRQDLDAIIAGLFKKTLGYMKNSVKDQGRDIDFHITMTYPGYLSDTTRDKLQSLMERAFDGFPEKFKSEKKDPAMCKSEEKDPAMCKSEEKDPAMCKSEEKDPAMCKSEKKEGVREWSVKIGSISYMTEEEAIVFGHLHTTNSLDHNFSESPFIVCNIGDICSSIARVPYKSAGGVMCEVERIDKCIGKDLLMECKEKGVDDYDLEGKVQSNPMTVADFRDGLPTSITRALCDTVVSTFSECLKNGLIQRIEKGNCDGIIVMGNSMLFEEVAKVIKKNIPNHSNKFAELPFSRRSDDGSKVLIDDKMNLLCALLCRTVL